MTTPGVDWSCLAYIVVEYQKTKAKPIMPPMTRLRKASDASSGVQPRTPMKFAGNPWRRMNSSA